MSIVYDKKASNVDKLKIYERRNKLLKQRTQGNWKNSIMSTGKKRAFVRIEYSCFDLGGK